jgi:alpha-aminoadipate carrier protein LysW
MVRQRSGWLLHSFARYPGGDKMQMCPECESDLDIEEEDLTEGDSIECPECGTEFEVVTTGPLELVKVGDEDEEELDDELDSDDEDE